MSGDYAVQRRRVWDRDQGRCVICGQAGTSVHHRQGRGGDDPHRLSNLLLTCGDGVTGCHRSVHAYPSISYRRGYMVHRLGIETPETTPVLTRTGWVLLDNHGGITVTNPSKENA